MSCDPCEELDKTSSHMKSEAYPYKHFKSRVSGYIMNSWGHTYVLDVLRTFSYYINSLAVNFSREWAEGSVGVRVSIKLPLCIMCVGFFFFYNNQWRRTFIQDLHHEAG